MGELDVKEVKVFDKGQDLVKEIRRKKEEPYLVMYKDGKYMLYLLEEILE